VMTAALIPVNFASKTAECDMRATWGINLM
jgi:hypothetical protein